MQMDGDESSNVEDRRGDRWIWRWRRLWRWRLRRRGHSHPMGGGGGGLFKGGIGFVAFIVIALIFGVDPMALLSGLGGGDTSTYTAPATTQSSRTARAPAADAETTFVSRVLKSTEDVWTSLFRDMGRQYVDPKLVLYRDATRTGCGTGQAAMGPFYCPADERVYLDLGLLRRSGEPLPRSRPVPAGLCDRPRGRPPRPEPARHHRQGRPDAPEHEQARRQRAVGAGRAAGRLLRRRVGQPRRAEERRQDDRRQGRRSGAGGGLGDRRRPAAEAGSRQDRARQLHPWQRARSARAGSAKGWTAAIPTSAIRSGRSSSSAFLSFPRCAGQRPRTAATRASEGAAARFV